MRSVERDHPLGRTLGELVKHPAFLRIRLKGLTRGEVGGYLDEVLGGRLSRDLAEKVYRRTEGNPLFMVEIARDMQERGEPDGWERAVPEGVKEAIGRRLGRLDGQCISALSMAAVIGRSFELALLAKVLGAEVETEVLERLELAQALGLVEEIEEVAGAYRFSHVLVQETLLAELSAMRKAQQNGRVAEAMEKLYGPDAGPRAGELARHLAEAGGREVSEKLARYTLQAAEYALAKYASDEALSLVDRVLAVREAQGQTTAKAGADTVALSPCENERWPWPSRARSNRVGCSVSKD